MADVDNSLEKELLDGIRGNGNTVSFSNDYIQKSRKQYFVACEESEIRERNRQAQAIEEASRIYLTF